MSQLVIQIPEGHGSAGFIYPWTMLGMALGYTLTQLDLYIQLGYGQVDVYKFRVGHAQRDI